MSKNETVTLPVPAPGNVYRQIPASISFHISGNSKVALDVTHNFDFEQPDCITDALVAAMVRQGDIRFVGTATTSAKEGESEKDAVIRRNEEIVAGDYQPGQGGGARLDTYTVVLRENIVTALVNNLGLKKGEAAKLVKDDSKAAYLSACAKRAESIDGQDADSIFAVMWPKMESHAKSEADRRDAAKGLDFDLGDFE